MSLFYDQDKYELSSNGETDEILAELPFNLIKESIYKQIDDPISIHINYIDIINDKCRIYIEEYDSDDTRSQILNNLKVFYIDIINRIGAKFNLGLDLSEIEDTNKIITIGVSIYRYFILRYTKNITKFIIKYIFKNKKEICLAYPDKSKKDVSTVAFKKHLKNPEDLCILTNLPSILRDILKLDIDSSVFIDLSTGIDNYDATIIKKLISDYKLIGDFYESYMALCVNSHDYIIDEIQTEIRIKIIKKITE